MTINDFITLDDYGKAETVSKAICLNNRSQGENKILIYDLGEFCVEVVYSLASKKISRFRFFRSDLQLDYIGQIDVR